MKSQLALQMEILKSDLVTLTLDFQRFMAKQKKSSGEYNEFLARLGLMVKRLAQLKNQVNREIATLQAGVQTPVIRAQILNLRQTKERWIDPVMGEWRRRVVLVAERA